MKYVEFVNHSVFHFYSFTLGLINVGRLRVEDRLSDLNNKPMDVSLSYFVYFFIFFILHAVENKPQIRNRNVNGQANVCNCCVSLIQLLILFLWRKLREKGAER